MRRAWSGPRAAPPDTVRLGTWSIDFYKRQRETYGFDSGFSGQGYVILAATRADQKAAADRIAMQQEQGLDVRWVDADEARRLSPTLAERGYRGGSYVATDGWLDPPTNVQAYLHAMRETGVELRERTDVPRAAHEGRPRWLADRDRRRDERRHDLDRPRDPGRGTGDAGRRESARADAPGSGTPGTRSS